jgi:tetratricopeptide (TPR) repeat protein
MMGLATASGSFGDAATEERYYRQIVSTPGANPNVVASAYCNLGVLHQGEASEIEYYQKCLELLPQNYAARYSLACAHASRKEWPEAISSFQQAIAVLKLDSIVSTDDSNDCNDSQSAKLLTALQSLYTATAHWLQSQPPPATREEMLQRFQEAMGVDNYNQLVALRATTR